MKERMDQSKLTGQEISVYFKKNPVKDKTVKKAVEFALDHGGAMSYAIKGIEKMKRGLSKHPDVKKALRYANESVHHESVWTVKNIVQENYTRNFETLCNSLKLNGIQQKILDDFIHKGRIRDQYVGRVAGSKKETRIFAGKKKFTGSIENRNEALTQALKVNAKQKSILDAYLKTGKVIGKYTGSMAGSTKTTKEYKGFRGFKEHFEARTIFETNLIIEGYSKKMSEKEVKAIEKKYGPMDKAEREDYLNKQYSPAKIARPDAWLAISYPVKDGEYYFALLGKEAQAKKWNDAMNKALKEYAKKYPDDPEELYYNFQNWVIKKVPSNVAAGDTMVREEIWAACLHILKKKIATVYVDEEVKEGKGSDLFKKYGSIINRLSDKEKDEVIELLYIMNSKSGSQYKQAFSKVKELLNMDYTPEGENLQEGIKGLLKKFVRGIRRLKAKGMPKGKKESVEEKIGDKRDWKKGFDPAEEAQLRKDKKLQKDLKVYYKNPRMSVKDAAKKVPYLLNHINTHFDGKDNGKVNDVQFSNAINFYYDSVYKESVNEARFGKTMKRSELIRKFGKDFQKALKTGNLELPQKAEDELIKYVMDNYPEEVRTDDPDEWIEWLDDNLEDFVKGRGYK